MVSATTPFAAREANLSEAYEFSCPPLSSPTPDLQDGPCCVGSCRRKKPQHPLGHFVCCTGPLHRNGRPHSLKTIRRAICGMQIGFNEPRCDGIDSNAFMGNL